MTIETLTVAYAYEVAYQFLTAAIAEGAHRQLNPRAFDTQARNRNILGTYFFTPVTLEGLGNIYGITKERTRQIIEGEVKELWRNCSPEVQRQFPLSEIPLRKRASVYWQSLSTDRFL